MLRVEAMYSIPSKASCGPSRSLFSLTDKHVGHGVFKSQRGKDGDNQDDGRGFAHEVGGSLGDPNGGRDKPITQDASRHGLER